MHTTGTQVSHAVGTMVLNTLIIKYQCHSHLMPLSVQTLQFMCLCSPDSEYFVLSIDWWTIDLEYACWFCLCQSPSRAFDWYKQWINLSIDTVSESEHLALIQSQSQSIWLWYNLGVGAFDTNSESEHLALIQIIYTCSSMCYCWLDVAQHQSVDWLIYNIYILMPSQPHGSYQD